MPAEQEAGWVTGQTLVLDGGRLSVGADSQRWPGARAASSGSSVVEAAPEWPAEPAGPVLGQDVRPASPALATGASRLLVAHRHAVAAPVINPTAAEQRGDGSCAARPGPGAVLGSSSGRRSVAPRAGTPRRGGVEQRSGGQPVER